MRVNDRIMRYSLIYKIEEKINFFIDKPIISLFIIGIVSLAIRLLFFEPDIPIRQDANAYFDYAMDMSILHYFPYSAHANDGWPMVLSLIFSSFNFDNYLDYTILQRITTIVISTLTIVPMYYLCKKFFNPTYSLVGAALFVFHPHIIQNSFLGLTESLYIILAISALSLFLSDNKKLMYYSFAIVAFATLVRAEGIILLFILSILFFIFNKKDKKIIGKFFISIIIFIIIFGSMTLIKIDTIQGVEGTAAENIVDWTYSTISNEDNSIGKSMSVGLENLIKRVAQSMIPYFALFVPFGLILLFKDKNKNKFLIMIVLIIYLIALVRMLSVVSDGRLLLVLYPLFVILSLYTIQHITEKFEFKKIFLILMICGCIILSSYFLYSNNDSEYQKEAYTFANYMVNNVAVSNNFYPESGLVYGAWASSELKYPSLSTDVEYTGPQLLDYVKGTYFSNATNPVYLTQSADSVEGYIKLARNQNLSHLVIDDNNKRTPYFKNIFHNEEKYPYLIKQFDSVKEGYTHYNVKVFKIDYRYFDLILTK